MAPSTAIRPQADEHMPYHINYISLVPEGDIVQILQEQLVSTQQRLRELSEQQGDFRYASDKWSVKEVIGHISDSERVFAYRALCFARNDKTPLPSFEQDDYMANANFSSRTLKDIAQEFEIVRRSTIALFQSLSEDAWIRRGTASDTSISVRALAYIIAGHELHHLNVLVSKYFNNF